MLLLSLHTSASALTVLDTQYSNIGARYIMLLLCNDVKRKVTIRTGITQLLVRTPALRGIERSISYVVLFHRGFVHLPIQSGRGACLKLQMGKGAQRRSSQHGFATSRPPAS